MGNLKQTKLTIKIDFPDDSVNEDLIFKISNLGAHFTDDIFPKRTPKIGYRLFGEFGRKIQSQKSTAYDNIEKYAKRFFVQIVWLVAFITGWVCCMCWFRLGFFK